MATSCVMRNFKKLMFQGDIDMDEDVFYIALLNGTSGLDSSTFETMLTLSAAQVYETSGTGYTAGGVQLTASAITLNGSNAVWDCSDISWSNSTITADGAVIYKLITNANDSPLVCFLDLNSQVPVGPKSSSNGTFTLQFNANGILNLVS